jgi:hypothetical protein
MDVKREMQVGSTGMELPGRYSVVYCKLLHAGRACQEQNSKTQHNCFKKVVHPCDNTRVIPLPTRPVMGTRGPYCKIQKYQKSRRLRRLHKRTLAMQEESPTKAAHAPPPTLPKILPCAETNMHKRQPLRGTLPRQADLGACPGTSCWSATL